MQCPNCGTQNSENNKFCIECGTTMPARTDKGGIPKPWAIPKRYTKEPQEQAYQIALISGITSLVGGGITIFGWLLPWFRLGNLIDTALNFFDIGNRLGFLEFGSGVGSGLQISLFSLFIGIAGFAAEDTWFFGILSFIIFAVIITIPILGIQIVRKGLSTIDLRTSIGKVWARKSLQDDLDGIKNRSRSVFVIMFIFFLVLSAIPLFGIAFLTTGFYLTAIGAVCSYLGVFLNESKLRSLPDLKK